MNRRAFVSTLLAAFPLTSATFATIATIASPLTTTAEFTSPTKYIDSDHPSIRAAVAMAVGDAVTPVERAVRIHDYVRDRIAFGWDASFYDQSASEVLRSGVGYCNTKGTLFVAMLRAAGIPARQHFVDIHARILAPFIDPGTPYVDHSFAEVMLDGRWLAVDSYIVDRPLFNAAKRKLQSAAESLGFGIHLDGACEWDGKSNSFAQFLNNGRFPTLSTNDHGVYEDVGAFYASGKGINKLNLLLKLGFGFFAKSANQRIAALRGAT